MTNSRVAADDLYDAYCFDETGDYIHRILPVYHLYSEGDA